LSRSVVLFPLAGLTAEPISQKPAASPDDRRKLSARGDTLTEFVFVHILPSLKLPPAIYYGNIDYQ
jgi:hypothetical protein